MLPTMLVFYAFVWWWWRWSLAIRQSLPSWDVVKPLINEGIPRLNGFADAVVLARAGRLKGVDDLCASCWIALRHHVQSVRPRCPESRS